MMELYEDKNAKKGRTTKPIINGKQLKIFCEFYDDPKFQVTEYMSLFNQTLSKTKILHLVLEEKSKISNYSKELI
jgi:hypothetical protein